MSEFVIDAHTLVWYLEDNPKLGQFARMTLNNFGAKLMIPAIAVAEACYVVAKGKTRLSSWQSLLAAVRDDPRVTVLPLDSATIETAMKLPVELEMHDAQVVAATLHRHAACGDAVLLTRDVSITGSGLVAVRWD